MSDLFEQQYTKMTKTPIGQLIISLSIPTIISMLITNIYNMADTFFVSKISLAASGATGIVFSVMAILQAFGFMFGHGAGSNISRFLGAKKIEKAATYASTSFFCSIFTGLIIMVVALANLEKLMYLLGSTDSILLEAEKYAFFILIASPAFTAGCVLNNILRYEGKANYAMIGLTAGGIMNMLIDPILIFGLDLKIVGAGLSTTISQYISTAILLWPFLKGKTVTKIGFAYVSKDIQDYVNIIVTGLPTFFRQGLNSISSSVLNIQAKPFGDSAIAAMSVVSRCCNLLFSIALGLGQGFQPVASFNYGSKDYQRVKKAFLFTTCLGSSILGLLCIFCYGKSAWIVSLFRKDPEVIQIGSQAFRYMCFVLYTLPLTSISSMLFQSTGEKKMAIFVSLVQSGLLYIPLLLILPVYLGLKGIQLALPITYFCAFLICIPLDLIFFRSLNQTRY